MEIKIYLYVNKCSIEKYAYFCMKVDFLTLNYKIRQITKQQRTMEGGLNLGPRGSRPWVLTTSAHFLTTAAVWDLAQGTKSQTKDHAQGVANDTFPTQVPAEPHLTVSPWPCTDHPSCLHLNSVCLPCIEP